MSRYSYFIRLVLWSFLIYNISAVFDMQLSQGLGVSKLEVTLFVAPVLEEFLKFVVARSLGKPVLVGLGIQATEMIVYGLDSLGKLAVSPHWITMLAYERYGIRWRALPIAIGIHFIWNAFWALEGPLDKLPAVGLLVTFFFAAFVLRNKFWEK